ncbi:MAG: 3-deoxy-manno-octulosonate cytidylyltransferase [Acidiferrobacteraceae bacterium]|nr:3-deoxy-manno-octulosonate cytidylyltransferase [Acidiferrobacteraceae bacterium]|tara:strand:+ start:977 stop:1750 length:774 start_codon:yes stop_codon:yes gene_type:complete
MKAAFDIVIPARLNSKRLPGKVLKDVAGKPLIQRVYDCARKSHARTIIIATDSAEVQEVARSFGAKVVMTKTTHHSGTDRIAEVATIVNWSAEQIIVNLQGDEPRMPGLLIDQAADLLIDNPRVRLATLCAPITESEDLYNPDIVKVVRNQRDVALYFSRSPVPFHANRRDELSNSRSIRSTYRHIGIYSYRVSYLKEFGTQKPSPMEKEEKLEQLRALWNGEPILVADAVEEPGPGIDSPSDLVNAVAYFSNHSIA